MKRMDDIKLKLQEEFTEVEYNYMNWKLAETLVLTPTLVKCHEIFNNKLLAQEKQSQYKCLVFWFILRKK